MNKIRSSMFVWTVFLALVFSAISTVPVFADEGTPPTTETPVVEILPVEETAEDVDSTLAEEEALPSSGETDSVSESDSPSVAEVIEALPEDTQLIVVNQEGETVPLVTQEAADAVQFIDPVWCPTGVAPKTDGTGGCTTSYGNLKLLVDALMNGTAGVVPGANGIIWIQSGTDVSSGAIILDGSDSSLVNMENFSLTLQGGWIGTSGSSTILSTPSSFSNSISITNWNNAITINNILIEGASGANSALEVETTGNITVTNVDVQNNTTTVAGAELDNTSGLGNVVVNDSTFNGNTGGSGLVVNSNGTITGKNLSAIGNGQHGAVLDNSYAIIAKAVTLTGSNNFKFNGYNGLTILSDGAITLSNITAIGNTGGSGAYLDNCQGFDVEEYCINSLASAVTLKGVNVFNNNGWDGLRVWSPGVITVNSVTANNNGTDTGRPAADVPYIYNYTSTDNYDAFGKGVFLNNWGAWTAKAINLTGNSTFNGNASNGLFAYGYSTIKANNITANDNGCDILYDTDTDYCAGAYIDAIGITLTGNNIFVGNTTVGLQAISYKTLVTLNNLYAESNGSQGVYVFTYGPVATNVSILGTNVFNDNGDGGLFVGANGIVTLYNLTANSNDASGVVVNNTDALTAKAVSIIGTNTFNGNAGYGLDILSYGAIVTNNLTVQFNGDGVYLDNCLYDGGSACLAYSPQAITMNGLNVINDNTLTGLTVVSQGAIKVNTLTATFNGDYGAVLDNQYSDAVGAISLTGYGNVSNNDAWGLLTWSTGAITLTNLTANDNGGVGVTIENDFNPLKPAAVTITGINQFSNNGDIGLTINSLGAVVLNNITANNNGDPVVAGGVYVNNASSLKPTAVTLNGINTFNNNFGVGLEIISLGGIVVNKLTANNNNDTGVSLDNQVSTFTAPITLLGYAILNVNNGDGLSAQSNGAITINNITANFNTGEGAYIYNFYNLAATSAVNVTVNGINTFNDNTADGLVVYSDGIITLNNITANDNGGFGAYLDNVTVFTNLLKNIVLNGYNNFVGNDSSGLYFNASGAVTITRITSDANNDGVVGVPQSSGVFGIAVGNITLTCGSVTYNEGSGYNLTSSGTITLKGIFSYGNVLINSASPAAVITRTCTLP